MAFESSGGLGVEDVAVAELRAAILRGELPPGVAVRQDVTARKFGMSVIPVREALKTLTAEGLVIHRPQLGYVVAELDPGELDGLYRVRELLEGEAERIAMRRVNGAKLAVMQAFMHAHRVAVCGGDAVGAVANNRRFHFVLFELCDNRLLRRYVRQTWDALDPYRAAWYRRALVVGDSVVVEGIHSEHQGIVDALAARDFDRAVDSLAEHRRAGHDLFAGFLRDGVKTR